MANIKRLNISTIKRNAVKRGALLADQWNDTFDELVSDLGDLSTQWNRSLLPLLATVPAGVEDSAVDAFINGLDGKTLWVDVLASTAATTIRYFNTLRNRPNTVKEQFEDVYTQLDALEVAITNLSTGATGVEAIKIGPDQLTGIVEFDGTGGIIVTHTGTTVHVDGSAFSGKKVLEFSDTGVFSTNAVYPGGILAYQWVLSGGYLTSATVRIRVGLLSFGPLEYRVIIDGAPDFPAGTILVTDGYPGAPFVYSIRSTDAPAIPWVDAGSGAGQLIKIYISSLDGSVVNIKGITLTIEEE